MKKGFLIFGGVLLLTLVGILVWWLCASGEDEARPTRAEEYRYKALDIVVAHLVRMEKPDARSVYLGDAAAEVYRPYFEHAGLVCATNNAPGAFKLVFVAGKGPHDWRALTAKVAEGGAMAWALDVRETTATDFQKKLTEFPCEATRVWMPGESDWLFTGRLTPCRLKVNVLLDAFSPDGAFEDLAEAQCDSLPQLFASYVGLREEILPAFQGDMTVQVRPEFFISREIPTIDWLVQGEADDDIWKAVRQEIRSMQVVRRVIAEGNLLALQQGKIDAAIDKWAAAMLRNPNDIMLLDRLYRLAVNARAFEKIGNLKGAAKCYETMISVRPKDAATIACYAACMRRLGYKEVADAAEKKAKELRK